MKKVISAIILVLIFTFSFAQDSTKKILKVLYKSVPFSQYGTDTRSTTSDSKRMAVAAVKNGYKTYYDLLINLNNRASIYTFDSLVFTKPESQPNAGISVADEVLFAIKPIGNITYKNETFFQSNFYSKGMVGDFEWEITDEKKKMLGFECIKAVSKNPKLRLTAWFTLSIPVSSGPAVYFGLPGLVVWVEDFYRTIQIEKITYTNDIKDFDAKLNKLQMDYKKAMKKNYTKEPIVILEKVKSANFLYKYFNPEGN